jgi:hypothetical protein
MLGHGLGIIDRAKATKTSGHARGHGPAGHTTTGRPLACASITEMPKVSSAMADT